MREFDPPRAQGLYDPRYEHDACGIGFCRADKEQEEPRHHHQRAQHPCDLRHRGAVGADPLAGDGAGILIQLPDTFLREETDRLGFVLPEPGEYAVGMVFLPRDPGTRQRCIDAVRKIVPEEGQILLGWRDVPTDNSVLGFSVKPVEPVIRQVFIKRGSKTADAAAFQRKLFVIRKQVHHAIWDNGFPDQEQFYVCSLSPTTIVYKGMILAENLSIYFPDLNDARAYIGDRAGASALFDQHLPVVEAGASVPLSLPQRRDQHRSRQYQLDAGAPAFDEVRSARRGPAEAMAADRRRLVGLRRPSTMRSNCWSPAATHCRTR